MTHTITDEQMKMVRDNIEYLANWQSKDGAAVVVEVATESLSILDAIEKQPVTVLDDADLQEKVCSILSKYGVEEIYDAEAEILYAMSRNRKAQPESA